MRHSGTLVILALGLTGCVHHGTFKNNVFSNREVRYQVGNLPGQWRLLMVKGNNLAFFNKKLGTTIQANAMCKDIDDASLKVLTNHLLIGMDKVRRLQSRKVPFDGREALHTIVEGRLDGVAIKLALYVAKKDNCIYDFAYFARAAHFARGLGDFRKFIGGFKTLR